MELVTNWIRALVGAAVFCALAAALCPEGRPKRVLRAACGVVMAAALLSPVAALDTEALPKAMARYSEACLLYTSTVPLPRGGQPDLYAGLRPGSGRAGLLRLVLQLDRGVALGRGPGPGWRE